MLTTPEGNIILQDSSGRMQVFSALGNSLFVKPNIVTRGLVSYWALEEDSMATGGIKDTAFLYGSNVINNGTRVGSAPVSDSGILGKCHYFSGDDYIQISNSPSLYPLDSGFSLEVWVYQASSSGSQKFVSYDNAGTGGYILQIDSGTVTALTYMNPSTKSVSSTSTIALGQWNQYVMTCTGNGNLKLYVNGILDNSVSTSGNAVKNPSNSFRIGADSPTLNYYFNGMMDEVKYYNVELTANEVLQNYQAYGPRIATKGLVSWWKLKDNAKDCAKMWSANGGNNDGTLTNGAYFLDNALKLDGDNDQCFIPSNASLAPSVGLTIMGWANLTAAGPSYQMFASGDSNLGSSWEFAAFRTSGFEILVYTTSGYQSMTNTLDLRGAGWKHIALTWTDTGSLMSLYIDGTLYAAETKAGTLALATRSVGIGGHPATASGKNLRGSMKDIMIYNRALSAGEIAMNYSAGRSK